MDLATRQEGWVGNAIQKWMGVMKHRTWIGSFAAPVIFLLSAALLATLPQASAHEGSVVVLRGMSPITDAGHEVVTREGDVTVVRGRPAPYEPVVRSEAEPLEPLEAFSGFNGWFIDHSTNRMGYCFRISTTEVGVDRIKCIWRRF